MMEKGYVQLEGHVKLWCFGWDWHLFWKATWQNFERLDVDKGGMVSTLDRTAGGEWLLLGLHTTLIMNDHANAQQFAYNLLYHLDKPRIMHHAHCWCTIYFMLASLKEQARISWPVILRWAQHLEDLAADFRRRVLAFATRVATRASARNMGKQKRNAFWPTIFGLVYFNYTWNYLIISLHDFYDISYAFLICFSTFADLWVDCLGSGIARWQQLWIARFSSGGRNRHRDMVCQCPFQSPGPMVGWLHLAARKICACEFFYINNHKNTPIFPDFIPTTFPNKLELNGKSLPIHPNTNTKDTPILL